MKPIITIDGTSGVGKGTLSASISAHYNYASLDTGSFFRAVTLYLIENCDINAIQPTEIVEIANKLLNSGHIFSYAKNPNIRTPGVSNASNIVYTNNDVRYIIDQYILNFCKNPLIGGNIPAKGTVVDGRTAGTAMFPNANAKIYMISDPKIKAQRRYKEYISYGLEVNYNDILNEIIRRDEIDSERAKTNKELQIAKDAFVLDTTSMDKQKVFLVAKNYIDGKLR